VPLPLRITVSTKMRSEATIIIFASLLSDPRGATKSEATIIIVVRSEATSKIVVGSLSDYFTSSLRSSCTPRIIAPPQPCAKHSNVRRRSSMILTYFARTPKIDTPPKTLWVFEVFVTKNPPNDEGSLPSSRVRSRVICLWGLPHTRLHEYD